MKTMGYTLVAGTMVMALFAGILIIGEYVESRQNITVASTERMSRERYEGKTSVIQANTTYKVLTEPQLNETDGSEFTVVSVISGEDKRTGPLLVVLSSDCKSTCQIGDGVFSTKQTIIYEPGTGENMRTAITCQWLTGNEDNVSLFSKEE